MQAGQAMPLLSRWCALRATSLRLLTLVPQRKPDMTANKQLKAELRPLERHGHVPGIAIGQEFANRGELAIVGIHAEILRGIRFK